MTTTDPISDFNSKIHANKAEPPLASPGAEALPETESILLASEDIAFDPENPWADDDEDDGLAESIQNHGILQPPRVYWEEALRKYMIVAGERRVRHAIAAGHTEILCVLDRNPSNAVGRHIERIAENLHRRSDRPMRLAKALEQLQMAGGFSQTQLSQLIHKNNSSFVSRKFSLLKFSPTQQAEIDAGKIGEGIAVEIAKVENEQERSRLFDRAVRECWSKERAIAAVSALVTRRKPSIHSSRSVKRVAFRLGEQGATIAVTAPETLPELSTEDIMFSLEFALREVKKAMRQNISARELATYLQKKITTKNRKTTSDPMVTENNNSPSEKPLPTASENTNGTEQSVFCTVHDSKGV